jgi:hypothetical protein
MPDKKYDLRAVNPGQAERWDVIIYFCWKFLGQGSYRFGRWRKSSASKLGIFCHNFLLLFRCYVAFPFWQTIMYLSFKTRTLFQSDTPYHRPFGHSPWSKVSNYCSNKPLICFKYCSCVAIWPQQRQTPWLPMLLLGAAVAVNWARRETVRQLAWSNLSNIP